MCRWLAYTGMPVLLDTVLCKPVHSLIDQSLHARMRVETTDGAGFRVGMAAAGLAMLADPVDSLSAAPGHRPDRGQRLCDLGTVRRPQSVGAMKQRVASGCGPTPGPYPDRRHP